MTSEAQEVFEWVEGLCSSSDDWCGALECWLCGSDAKMLQRLKELLNQGPDRDLRGRD